MMKPLMIFGMLLAATPLAAQQTFATPDGCTAKLTVQHKGCVLVNVWTCEADDEGDQWMTLIGEAGLFSLQRVDAEFQWLESYKVTGSEKLDQPAPDPASLSELLQNQVDTFDFTLITDQGPQRNVGYDQLTGETVEIDGETLYRTLYEGKTFDAEGNEIEANGGRQYVSEKHRLFLLGEAWDAATPDQVTDLSPVEFIYPGEAGFFVDRPKYECGVIESGYDQ